MKFYENLKYLRKKEGLTQEELAEKLNVSRQSVTKWESGQALPDIEKVKEIAYLFSVSVDSLVGEIESKTENRLKKKINDIGYFIFAYVILAIMAILSITTTINELIKDEIITGIALISSIIVAFILFVTHIKMYLRNNNEIILNMKDTEEGKKERRKYLIKKYLILFTDAIVFCFIIDLGSIASGNETILNSLLTNSLGIGLITGILLIYELKKIEKEVKTFNDK